MAGRSLSFSPAERSASLFHEASTLVALNTWLELHRTIGHAVYLSSFARALPTQRRPPSNVGRERYP